MLFNTGLILEGGGMRGVYTAGVLDYFLDQNIMFTGCYAVSAGLVNATNFISQQKGRTFRIVTDYLGDRNYSSLYNLIFTGNFFGVDMLYNRIPNELDLFDYNNFIKSKTKLTAVISNLKTGKAEYIKLKNLKKEMSIIRASCSLPLISTNVKINGQVYLDGGMCDSIPLKKSIIDGYKKNVVILTQDSSFVKKPVKLQYFMARVRYFRYFKMMKTLCNRHHMYNNQLKFVRQQQQMGNVFVIQPKQPVAISRMEKDKQKMLMLYKQGYNDAKESERDLLKFLCDSKV